MQKGYSLENFCRVYDDTHGCYYEIRPDTDGLDCVEVTYHDGGPKGDVLRCFTVPPEMARLLAEAIAKVAGSLPTRESR
jgi:hypothetical protein